jgi:hypothetical protein
MTASVYVMTNIAMPGLVKVGVARDVAARAAQLSSPTGVPCRFEVAFEMEIESPFEVEAIAHQLMREVRIEGREFFVTNSRKATKALQLAALISAWNKAGPEAREEFLSRIDQPLMDRRYGT